MTTPLFILHICVPLLSKSTRNNNIPDNFYGPYCVGLFYMYVQYVLTGIDKKGGLKKHIKYQVSNNMHSTIAQMSY